MISALLCALLGSICLIKFIGSKIELKQSSVFDLVRLPNSIELNPWILFTMPGMHLESLERTQEATMGDKSS